MNLQAGMVIKLEPTKFLLAQSLGSSIKEPKTDNTFLTVVQNSVLLSGLYNSYTRLYLPKNEDTDEYIQLVIENDQVKECRYFFTTDVITPGASEDWDLWLNEETGLLGGQQIETPDGNTYQRVWSPSDHRIKPLLFKENNTEIEMMLYSRQLGEEDQEFLLVSLVNDNDKAWIQIDLGIDLNHTTLNLS